MLKKNVLLLFLLVVFVTNCFGQGKEITNEEYRFTLTYPVNVLLTDVGDTVLEFRGTKKKYGEEAIFFLKSIKPVKISPIEKFESYMQDTENIESLNAQFIDSMKISFPDITSINKSFIYFSDRPTIQGTYSFTKEKAAMKGRFMLVLIKEQSSIYSFSWTSKASKYESWNEASEKSVKSLKISDNQMIYSHWV